MTDLSPSSADGPVMPDEAEAAVTVCALRTAFDDRKVLERGDFAVVADTVFGLLLPPV
ncbi:hypothetical protein GCM10010495_61320 [Kitasatospora herbaricolor]|uniref:hypothetical protein n=1 Tax=Kitasatospora herbaricolor TaxID=68217 RepID=UPI00174E8A83|nr:hypothetical protein [Kitasatospora herbaricolor]MDQ0312840.1 hypothetical protein [Kitasatospora herbaricolor]GGV36026.1 hypothetical protein GCM10010495_61320 [Kitasatospora herbaricolor]